MTSLREHVNTTDQAGFVNVPLGRQRQQQQHGPSRGIQVSRKVVVLGSVAVVAVVATAAILAVTLKPGSSPGSPGAAAATQGQHEPGSNMPFLAKNPLQLIKEKFHFLQESLPSLQQDVKNKEKKVSQPSQQDFVEELVPLERTREHDTGVALRPEVHRNLHVHHQFHFEPHPHYVQEEVPLERNVAHN